MRDRKVEFSGVPPLEASFFHEPCQRYIIVGPGLDLIALPKGAYATRSVLLNLRNPGAVA